MTRPGPRRAKIGEPGRPFAREREGLELRHGAGFKRRRLNPTRVHPGAHTARSPAPWRVIRHSSIAVQASAGAAGHADQIRVQHEGLSTR
jgi:hypothetical protein